MQLYLKCRFPSIGTSGRRQKKASIRFGTHKEERPENGKGLHGSHSASSGAGNEMYATSEEWTHMRST